MLEDFIGSKTLDELVFLFTPIWIRVSKLPMGLMNKATMVAIGDEMGEFLDVDFETDVLAIGPHLCLKVRIYIRKPLMIGVTISLGEQQEDHGVHCHMNSYQIFATNVGSLVIPIRVATSCWGKMNPSFSTSICVMFLQREGSVVMVVGR